MDETKIKDETRRMWISSTKGIYSLALIFFFSSRRRHTRLQGDWSSDVCSSDLIEGQPADGGDDAVSRGLLGRAFQGALHQRLGGECRRPCRVDQRGDDRPRGREIGRASCRERV